MYYVISAATGSILCNDGKYRFTPLFGTYRSCIKVYKTKHHALNAAKRSVFFVNTRSQPIVVMWVNHNIIMDSDGFYMNGRDIIWRGNTKTFSQWYEASKNGEVEPGFPVKFFQ